LPDPEGIAEHYAQVAGDALDAQRSKLCARERWRLDFGRAPDQASGMPAETQPETSSSVAANRFSISSTCAVVMIIGGQKAMLSPMARMIKP
jgi:hypothetical protein